MVTTGVMHVKPSRVLVPSEKKRAGWVCPVANYAHATEEEKRSAWMMMMYTVWCLIFSGTCAVLSSSRGRDSRPFYSLLGGEATPPTEAHTFMICGKLAMTSTGSNGLRRSTKGLASSPPPPFIIGHACMRLASQRLLQ